MSYFDITCIATFFVVYWYTIHKPEIVMIRLPAYFFWDHYDRELPTPLVIKKNLRHVWISELDPEIPELLNDAEFYESEAKYMDGYRGLGLSARATVKILRQYYDPETETYLVRE